MTYTLFGMAPPYKLATGAHFRAHLLEFDFHCDDHLQLKGKANGWFTESEFDPDRFNVILAIERDGHMIAFNRGD